MAERIIRVAAIGDLHYRPGVETKFRSLFAEISEAADILLLCGDIIDYGLPEEARLLMKDIAETAKRITMIGVLGNHDYARLGHHHIAVERPPALEALQQAGISVLVNRSVRLAWKDRSFWLAGLADQIAVVADGRPLADLGQTLAAVKDDAPIILMAHEPDIFPEVPDRVALTLSGHLHHGQIRFFGHAPVVPSRFGQRFLHGHIIEAGRHLIVGAGLGHSGVPLRFQAAPEIVLIELGGKNG